MSKSLCMLSDDLCDVLPGLCHFLSFFVMEMASKYVPPKDLWYYNSLMSNENSLNKDSDED